jgi:glycosyltransferase involved in cell wall biosynthesis
MPVSRQICSCPPNAPPPVVSVAMITYNHEKFIVQAVESVMMQQTRFPYELVISDDRSPDRTREIVVALQKKHPDRIRLVLPESNLGAVQNHEQNLRACRGRYIALLEGDDYWTDPGKLQKQVDFLEAHPQCPACFALTRVVGEDDVSQGFFIPSEHMVGTVIRTEDLLEKNCIATCSLLLRNIIPEIHFEAVAHLKMGDWPLNLVLSERGPIACLREPMAVYRLHEGGLWTAMTELERLQSVAEMYQAMRKVLAPRHRPALARRVVRTYQLMAQELMRRGETRSAQAVLWRSLPWTVLADWGEARWLLKESVIRLFHGWVRRGGSPLESGDRQDAYPTGVPGPVQKPEV